MINNNIATMLLQQRKYREAEEFLQRMEKAELYSDELEGKRKEKMAAIRSQIAADMEQIKKFMQQPRNSPCRCGSGKKVKHWHGA